MDILKLVQSKIDLEEVSESVGSSSCGAISIFIGTTRNNFEGKQVTRLEYEAYDEMALTEMKKLCTEVRGKWKDIEHISIVHRLGVVPVKEASVVIAISSPHRKDSLDAVHFAIEALKTTVPIWKKEIYEGDTLGDSLESSIWKENKECPWHATST